MRRPDMRHGIRQRLGIPTAAATWLALALVACGDGAPRASTPAAPAVAPTELSDAASTATAMSPTVAQASDALAQDAQWYADHEQVSLDEAIRRLQLQGAFPELEAELRTYEPDTFAGFWIQHQPQFRFVAQFTRDGEQTIQRYIAGKPHAELVEVRNSARFTLVELDAAHAEAIRALRAADVHASSGTNVQQNHVEVYVFDPAQVEAKLRTANVELPDSVVLIADEQGSATAETTTPPLTSIETSPPGVVFLRQAPVDGPQAYPSALAEGKLVVADGCLRLKAQQGEASLLPIWPPDYTLSDDNGVLAIRDGAGHVVARVGDEIQLGGGEIPADESAWLSIEALRRKPPSACPGPYWLAAPIEP